LPCAPHGLADGAPAAPHGRPGQALAGTGAPSCPAPASAGAGGRAFASWRSLVSPRAVAAGEAEVARRAAQGALASLPDFGTACGAGPPTVEELRRQHGCAEGCFCTHVVSGRQLVHRCALAVAICVKRRARACVRVLCLYVCARACVRACVCACLCVEGGAQRVASWKGSAEALSPSTGPGCSGAAPALTNRFRLGVTVPLLQGWPPKTPFEAMLAHPMPLPILALAGTLAPRRSARPGPCSGDRRRQGG
jgi:hypothetical protein